MRKPTGNPAYGKENRSPQNKTKSCLKKTDAYIPMPSDSRFAESGSFSPHDRRKTAVFAA